jgi:C4-type Zn-finger protein
MEKNKIKPCPVCAHKMVIVLDKPTFPNEKIVVKLHYKCKKCGCNVYKTNIMELAEELIQKKVKEFQCENEV